MTNPMKWAVAGSPLADAHARQWQQVALTTEQRAYNETVMVMLNTLEPHLVVPVVRCIMDEIGRPLERWDVPPVLRR